MPGKDLLHALSTNELKREIERLVKEDQRSLPPRPKVFAAVATLQKFDLLPEVAPVEEIDKMIAAGNIELQRGMTAIRGVPVEIYAQELARGPMYPGTLSAMGNGIYFSTPLKNSTVPHVGFPKISDVALKYARCDTGAGILVRGVLDKAAHVLSLDDLKEAFRDFKNRAKSAGITDMGAFAAAIGYDAFHCDGLYDDNDERVWVVLNRNRVTLQITSLKILPAK